MIYDVLTTVEGSLIQHGKYNDRIYLLKLGNTNVDDLVFKLDSLAERNGYGKILAKIPISSEAVFLNIGYKRAAVIPRFYSNCVDCVFLEKFLEPEREVINNKQKLGDVVALGLSKHGDIGNTTLNDKFQFHYARPENAAEICKVYQEVFASYPFPIHDADYILKTMKSDVLYFTIWSSGRIVAVSSAEIDIANSNAEMTDFATLPNFRGNGFALYLLKKMEQDMRKLKISTVYTIARAKSESMNITFSKAGYNYSGCLVNNTQICNSIESMNIWHKKVLC